VRCKFRKPYRRGAKRSLGLEPQPPPKHPKGAIRKLPTTARDKDRLLVSEILHTPAALRIVLGTHGPHVAVEQIIRLRLERHGLDLASKTSLVAKQCSHANQLAVSLPIPACRHGKHLVQASAGFVE